MENADLAAANENLRSLVQRAGSSQNDLLDKCREQRVKRIAITDKAIAETVGSVYILLRSIAHTSTDGRDPGYRKR